MWELQAEVGSRELGLGKGDRRDRFRSEVYRWLFTVGENRRSGGDVHTGT